MSSRRFAMASSIGIVSGCRRVSRKLLLTWASVAPPTVPWWQEFLEEARQQLLTKAAGLIVAAACALLALGQRKTLGRWWNLWLERRRHVPAQTRMDRQRQLLALSMRRLWIEGYLDAVLDMNAVGRLPVGITTSPDGSNNYGYDLAQIWDDDRLGRRKFRLVGEWGTGKTVHLLMLARFLLDRAADPAEPVPVVLNVSGWNPREGTFDQWVLNEVVRRHRKDVTRNSIRDLLSDGQIALLLDGVDEHADPEGCAKAINSMLEFHVGLPVVVTYRTDSEDPSRQQMIERHLDWLDPALVRPLDRMQVDRLLADAGPVWRHVREVIAKDVDLWEPLIRRPLLLSVILRAFRDQPADAIATPAGTGEQRLAQIYDAYLAEMLRRAPVGSAGPAGTRVADAEPTRRALAWLADTAERCRLGTTVYLEHIAPCWLPDGSRRMLRRRQRVLSFGLIAAILWAAAGIAVWELLQVETAAINSEHEMGALTLALSIGLVTGLAYGLAWTATRLASGLMVGLLAGLAVGFVIQLLVGLEAGAGLGLSLGLAGATLAVWEARQLGDGPVIVTGRQGWSSERFRRRWTSGLGVALGVGLGVTVGGVLGAFGRGESSEALFNAGWGGVIALVLIPGVLVEAGVETRPTSFGEAPYPTVLRRHMLRGGLRGLFVGLGAGLVFGLISWLVFAKKGGLTAAVTSISTPHVNWLPAELLGLGLGFGAAAALTGGFTGILASVSYALVHSELRSSGLIRDGLLNFLNDCVDHRRPILLPVGHGYRFLHPTLQAHLAREWRQKYPAIRPTT